LLIRDLFEASIISYWPIKSDRLLDDESIAEAGKRGLHGGDTRKIKESVAQAIEEYTKLYELYQNYESKM
jgi:hypothetical protein